MARDEDLLFAVFALQMNFITRRHFVNCGRALADDPDASLADLLEREGHVDAGARRALEDLVAAHVRTVGKGDASASVSSLPLGGSLLEGGTDMDLLANLTASLGEEDVVGFEEIEPGAAAGRDERYLLGEEIGRGGLGRVIEAEDTVLNRSVAVKEMFAQAERTGFLRRFLREGEIAGRLTHPNIIPVHDIGVRVDQGRKRPYFVMTRIHGRDLKDILEDVERDEEDARREFSRPRLLRIFQDICKAVAYAHDHGVIHRDLKPANVMVGQYGEVYVVDWGLAKLAWQADDEEERPPVPESAPDKDSAAIGLTLEGQILGTPAYMPPEQAEGRTGQVDERSDIYSLGAILYELLTLRPPYEGETAINVIASVLKGDLTPPAERAEIVRRELAGPEPAPVPPAVPPELEEICTRAMARKRADRYATVLDLHEDVQQFLEGEKERERRRAEAARLVAQGRAHVRTYQSLLRTIKEKSATCLDARKKMKAWEPVERKRPYWEMEAEVNRLREERMAAFSRAEIAFSQAVLEDPDSRDALDGKAGLYFDRYLGAEERRDKEEMTLYRTLLAEYDHSGAYRRRIEEPGTLTLRTFRLGCRSLGPVPGFAVRVADEVSVPYRRGRFLFGEEAAPDDRAIPDLRVTVGGEEDFPALVHGETCRSTEVLGVEVTIHPFEEVDRHLELGPGTALGRTPLKEVVLEQGSYLCVLRAPDLLETRVPVHIGRGAAWSQEVNLWPVEAVPAGFCMVPAGPFTAGGDRPGVSDPYETWAEDILIAREPVTFGEYAAFLTDLAREDPVEARRRQPRESDARFLVEAGGRWRAPEGDEPNPLGVTEDLPLFGVSWYDAVAYTAWLSAREGRLYTLPHEDEWEKAARGVDGRLYPWGDVWDTTFANIILSHEKGPRLRKAGSFPVDRSPYGLVDMAGNMSSWCLNAPEGAFRDDRLLRGGAWCFSLDRANAAVRMGLQPLNAHRHTGLRLVLRPLH